MYTLSYAVLPLTDDPRQVFTLDMTIGGEPFHARVEVRYLSAPDRWVISIWDNASSELLVSQIPLVCSYGELNDLLLPFRYLRDGNGAGSLFVIRNTGEPPTTASGGSFVGGEVNRNRAETAILSLRQLRLRNEPSSADPGKDNLTEFQVLWGDTMIHISEE